LRPAASALLFCRLIRKGRTLACIEDLELLFLEIGVGSDFAEAVVSKEGLLYHNYPELLILVIIERRLCAHYSFFHFCDEG